MKIFINYRQKDTSWSAGYLANELKNSFGEKSVFIDERNIDVGDSITYEINAALEVVKVLIVMIDTNWLFLQDDSGRRRIDGPKDWVRHEIKACLDRKDCLVIPILLEETTLPSKSALPENIQKLSDCKGIRISRDDKTSNVSALINRVEKYLNEDKVETVKIKPNKIIYEKLSQNGRLDLSNFENPYNYIFDPDSWEERKVFCAICFPKIDFIKNAQKSIQIPAIAICFDSNYKLDVKSLMDEALYNKFLMYSPAKLFNEDKEKILINLLPIFNHVFVAGVTLPAMLFSSKVDKRKYQHTYAALINSLITPLLNYHDSIEYILDNIEIASVGSSSNDTKLLTVLNSEVEIDVCNLENKEVECVVRMLTWCIGTAINNENLDWINIIKES